MPIKVNGEIIPDSAVRYELNRLVAFYSEHTREKLTPAELRILQRRAMEQAIGAKLLLDEAKRQAIPVSEESVAGRVNQFVERCGGRERYEQILRKQGLNEEGLRASILRGKQVDVLVGRITSDVADPTDEEIAAYYKEHPDVVARPARALARHIMIKPAGEGEADRQVAEARLNEIRTQVAEGKDFAELAAAYSDCESGRKTGGSLGWIRRNTMVPEFEEAVFSLKVGEVSQVVKTSLGYHIIQKVDEETGGPVSLDDCRDKVRDLLKHMRNGKAISEFVDRLRRTAVIEDVENTVGA